MGGCLALRVHLLGPLGRVFTFVRPLNGRCPACDFLKNLESQFRRRFSGSFDALTKVGASYYNDQRFKALIGNGKPLWEFKEHDHRIYCYRQQDSNKVDVVLLDGWIKDKRGKTEVEKNHINTAQNLRAELLGELRGVKTLDNLLEAKL